MGNGAFQGYATKKVRSEAIRAAQLSDNNQRSKDECSSSLASIQLSDVKDDGEKFVSDSMEANIYEISSSGKSFSSKSFRSATEDVSPKGLVIYPCESTELNDQGKSNFKPDDTVMPPELSSERSPVFSINTSMSIDCFSESTSPFSLTSNETEIEYHASISPLPHDLRRIENKESNCFSKSNQNIVDAVDKGKNVNFTTNNESKHNKSRCRRSWKIKSDSLARVNRRISLIVEDESTTSIRESHREYPTSDASSDVNVKLPPLKLEAKQLKRQLDAANDEMNSNFQLCLDDQIRSSTGQQNLNCEEMGASQCLRTDENQVVKKNGKKYQSSLSHHSSRSLQLSNIRREKFLLNSMDSSGNMTSKSKSHDACRRVSEPAIRGTPTQSRITKQKNEESVRNERSVNSPCVRIRPLLEMHRKNLNHQNSDLQKMNYISKTSPGRSCEDNQEKFMEWNELLSCRLAEVEFMLHDTIQSDQDFRRIALATEVGLAYLENLSIRAEQLGVRMGQLSRWLLPYNLDTIVTNQRASTPATVKVSMPQHISSRITDREVSSLVYGASVVRSLVRFKIADDNDLYTAREALRTVDLLVKQVTYEACRRGEGCTPYEILQEKRNFKMEHDQVKADLRMLKQQRLCKLPLVSRK